MPLDVGCRSRLPAFRIIGCSGLLVGLLSGCGGDPSGPEPGARLALELSGVRSLDPLRDGTLEAWVQARDGSRHSLGRISVPEGAERATLEFELPVADPELLSVTVEPPGDQDDAPSPHVLMSGDFQGSRAELSIEGFVTNFSPLEPDPGSHSLFTTSNNVELGYPSFEDAGIWMFTLRPKFNKHETREVHVTPLKPTWLYEGWIVKDLGTPAEIWISYGKFRPDVGGLLTSRDDTGSGPFSGDEDYLNAGVEDVPGDEWTTSRVADQLGFRLPGGVEPPLDLDAVDSVTGVAVWSHVITIEPGFDEGEPLYSGQPFLLRPYLNPIGEGGPGDPRLIVYQQNDPHGEVRPAG